MFEGLTVSEDHIDRRDYGKLEAKVEQLTKDMHEMRVTLREVRDMMNEARGGWRVVMLIGGVSGTLGAAVAWIASHIQFAR